LRPRLPWARGRDGVGEAVHDRAHTGLEAPAFEVIREDRRGLDDVGIAGTRRTGELAPQRPWCIAVAERHAADRVCHERMKHAGGAARRESGAAQLVKYPLEHGHGVAARIGCLAEQRNDRGVLDEATAHQPAGLAEPVAPVPLVVIRHIVVADHEIDETALDRVLVAAVTVDGHGGDAECLRETSHGEPFAALGIRDGERSAQDDRARQGLSAACLSRCISHQ